MGRQTVPSAGRRGLPSQAERGDQQLSGIALGDRAIAASLTAATVRSIPARALVALLNGYKRWLSPVLPQACRFTPTCSEYARLAILKHGAARGSLLAAGRLARCQPFHPGGVDLP